MAKVVVPVDMTKVERGEHPASGHLTQGTETMRRSRSLSELPGHHRVPILKRKDTERTQARLEAGEAGVKELRALRQQQQQLMEETLAQHKKSRVQARQMTEIGDQSFQREPDQLIKGLTGQQVYEPNVFSSMSWFSTNSLASIREEKAARGQAMKPDDPCMPVNPSQINPQRRGQKQSQSLRHESVSSRYPHQTKQYVHLSHQGRSADAVNPKCQLLRGSHSIASLDTHTTAENNNSKSAHRNLSTTHRSSSQTYLPNEQLKSGLQFMPNPKPLSLYISSDLDPDHRRSVVQLQSDQRFARGRTQSVHESFYYFPFHSKEIPKNEPQNVAQKSQESNDKNTLHTTSRSKRDLSSDYKGGELSQKTDCHSGTLTSFCNQSLHSDTISPASPRNKSISWDELLVTIGLNNKNQSASNSEIGNSNLGECEASETRHNSNAEREQNCEISGTEKVIKKSGRSQSFTSGTLNFHNLNTEDPDCIQLVQKPNEHGLKFNHGHRPISSQARQRYMKNVSGHQSSAMLSRRPSIQSEAVITRNDPLRKILNPLHEVDIKSMNVPGPLHAVTLQYSGLPGRKLSQSELFPSTLSQEISKESNISSFESRIIMSEVTQQISGNPLTTSKDLHSQNQTSKNWDDASQNNYDFTQNNQAKKGLMEPKQKHSSKEKSLHVSEYSSENILPCNETQKSIRKAKLVKRSLFPNNGQLNSEMTDENSINQRLSSGELDSSAAGGHQNLQEGKSDMENFSHATCDTIEEENDDMMDGVDGKMILSQGSSGHALTQTSDVNTSNTCTQYEQKVVSTSGLPPSGNEISPDEDLKRTLVERSGKCNLGNLEVMVDLKRVEQNNDVKSGYPPQLPCDLHEHRAHRSRNETPTKNKLDDKSSCQGPFSPSRPVHASDVNLFLDEGYSTCDSVSPKCPSNKYGLHSSDNSSMSSGSISNVSALGDGLFSQHDACGTSKESDTGEVSRHISMNHEGYGKAHVSSYTRNSNLFKTISETDSGSLESSIPDNCKTEKMTSKKQEIFTKTVENKPHRQSLQLSSENLVVNDISVRDSVCTKVPSAEQVTNNSTSPSESGVISADKTSEKLMNAPISLGGTLKRPFKQTAV